MALVTSAGSTSVQTTGRLIEDKRKESLSGTLGARPGEF